MRLTFKLRFHTEYGQSLWLAGDHAVLGNDRFETALPLQYVSDEFWQVTITLPEQAIPDVAITYTYILRQPDGSLVYDWGRGRAVNPARCSADSVMVIDAWNPASLCENTFYTEPFRQVLLRANHSEVRTAAPPRITHTFRVKAPLLDQGQTLCLLGNATALGQWNTAAPILQNRVAGEDYLTADLDLTETPFPIAYKYGIYDVTGQTFVRYEDGSDRRLDPDQNAGQRTVINDGFARLPAATWRGAGVAIPVFSLRSETSFGVGEFTDLMLLADWCERTGLKLIQILPINDTTATHTWTDSYPYAAISAFALHPQYLNLSRVATGENRKLLQELEPERQRLNALATVDYEAVLQAKLGFVRRIYPSEKTQTFRSQEYGRFFERNQAWLVPYAVFCYWRDQQGTADFNRWPVGGRYDAAEVAALAAKGASTYDEIARHYFIQYHLHRQLEEVTACLHAKGVILKGDLPIGVARHGADVWQEPELFHLDMQAGAPPDAFTDKGQNWGFPTYNWPRMKADGFAWWKRRFEQMGHYFDAFRIDHILGFFRIWSVPLDAVEGLLGHFVPMLPVSIDEFQRRGIQFNRNRYCQPFISDAVLSELFGTERDEVIRRFLQPDPAGNLALRSEFATQRQVEQFFAAADPKALNQRLKQGLFGLISNVILFPAEESPDERFHFRFAIDKTLSFQNLAPETRGQLWELYLDYFFHRQEAFWMKEAMQKLPALKRVTNMLVCGEDLGLVPACVPEAMRQLGLLTLEVQRMPKRLNQTFSRPQDAPYLSVVTPSTHDMPTIRAWWRTDRPLIQRFFEQELGQPGDAPPECEPWISRAIVLQHLASPAMWSIFQLQDLLGMDESLRRQNPDEERINDPANPKHYWRYRMHLTLENLLQATEFNEELKRYMQKNGRKVSTVPPNLVTGSQEAPIA